MQVVYTATAFPPSWTSALFLAGPSPRSFTTLPSWRPRALAHLRARGYDGAVFVPEPESGDWPEDYEATTGWELEGLALADVIVFWVPRHREQMPGFTTNVEYGLWVQSHKAELGHPPDAPSTRYLDALAHRIDGARPASTLEETLDRAMQRVGPGAPRTGGERGVPLHVWSMPSVQGWASRLRADGQELVEARVSWCRRAADGAVDLAVLEVHTTTGRHTLAFAPTGDPVALPSPK